LGRALGGKIQGNVGEQAGFFQPCGRSYLKLVERLKGRGFATEKVGALAILEAFGG